MNEETGRKGTRTAKITIDLTRIADDQFAPEQPLRIAAIRDDEVVDEQIVTPAEERDPREFEVELNLGRDVDGVAGATIVVAPAEDPRNVFSILTTRKFVAGAAEIVDGGYLQINPNIYKWWRYCWFPRTFHITGRVVRTTPDCPQPNPVVPATVEVYDVDFCWWWFSEDLITSVTTDAAGFFEIEFTWCVPLWCFLRPLIPPLYIDPILRDRLWDIIWRHIPIPDPPPDDPWRLEDILRTAGVKLPGVARPIVSPLTTGMEVSGLQGMASPQMAVESGTMLYAKQTASFQPLRSSVAPAVSLDWKDLFGGIIDWPICDGSCDWLPDIRLRVIQNQPGTGTVEIYSDSFFDIHWNLDHDLNNIVLEASPDALYVDVCQPQSPLGNCMIFERVGHYGVDTIYQPDLDIPSVTASYGATPDRKARMGRTVSMDRAWCLTTSIYGDFGIAAQVDYYRVEIAKWTTADLNAWELNPKHRPPDSAFAPVAPSLLSGFSRSYLELQTPGPYYYYVWRSEPFAPHTVAGITGLYKSRQRFQTEYLAAHGGVAPAPDFGGWYFNTFTMTRLFNIDTSKLSDGLYTFRIIGYTQTGVDGSGNPILSLVNMGLPDGVCKRCGGTSAPDIPELLTMLMVNNPHVPDCQIVSMKKNNVQPIDDCEILILDTTDSVTVTFQASDSKGNLERYILWLQRGADAEHNMLGYPGVTITPVGVTIDGPTYPAALVHGATAPYWYGGTWTAEIPASVFQALGGSCAYVMTVGAWDRQTNGWSSGYSWDAVECGKDRAFTVVMTADKSIYCAQLGC